MALALGGTTTISSNGQSVVEVAVAYSNPAANAAGGFIFSTVPPLSQPSTISPSNGGNGYVQVATAELSGTLLLTTISTIVASPPFTAPSNTSPTSAQSNTANVLVPTTSPATNPSTSSPPPSSRPASSSLSQSTKASNSSAQPASTSSPTKRTGTTSTEKGLIAATAVLGALFLLALIALFFLSRRKRRSGDQRGDYTTAYVPKGVDGSSNSSHENTINALETQLRERDTQLKASQAALLKKGRSTGSSGLDDRYVNERFSKLSKGINDWVLTHFKNMRPGVSPGRDLATMLQRSQPNYAALLGDPRAKYLVIRSLVAETLSQAFATGEFLSNPAFSELNQTVGSTASPVEANEWRALTMPLLEKSSEYRSDRAAVVQEISKKIDFMTSTLAGLGPSDGRLSHLNQVVEAAATLAMDLAKQRSLFKVIMDRPGSTTFDATSMEDVLQDHKGEKLQGRPIQSVVFPAVKRWGDDSGTGYDIEHIISKAQVLV